MPAIFMQNLGLFLPMTFAGLLLLGEVPVASRAGRGMCKVTGAIIGALLAIVVIEVLPALI